MSFTYDPSTTLGRLRSLLGDTRRDISIFSDEELNDILGLYNDNIYRSGSEAFLRLASRPHDLKRKYEGTDMANFREWSDEARSQAEQLAALADSGGSSSSVSDPSPFTYSTGTTLGRLRELLGDTVQSSAAFDDDELNNLLSDYEDNVYLAAAEAMQRLAGRSGYLARKYDNINPDQRAEHARTQSEQLRTLGQTTEARDNDPSPFTYDPTTTLGRLRALLGDTDQQQGVFDDDELNDLLTEQDDNIYRAASEAYLRLANRPLALRRKYEGTGLQTLGEWANQARTQAEEMRTMQGSSSASSMSNPTPFTYTVGSTLGRLRELLGDTEADTAVFNDDELNDLLGLYGDNIYRAAAEGYLRLAGRPESLRRKYGGSGDNRGISELSQEARNQAEQMREMATQSQSVTVDSDRTVKWEGKSNRELIEDIDQGEIYPDSEDDLKV